nr:hypothetical protein BaRGS_031211 [Batillaria attramentaria]
MRVIHVSVRVGFSSRRFEPIQEIGYPQSRYYHYHYHYYYHHYYYYYYHYYYHYYYYYYYYYYYFYYANARTHTIR